MSHGRIRLFAHALAGLTLLLTMPWALTSVQASVDSSKPSDSTTLGRYIVTFKSSVDHPGALAERQVDQHDGQLGFIYRHAIVGYSVTDLSRADAKALRKDPRVEGVTPDRKMEIFSPSVPTGVQRSFAFANPSFDIDETDDVRIDADVAVIDTGIDYTHPDLDVVERVNCIPDDEKPTFKGCIEDSGKDDHGHGTHVAGTIGALDNGYGVVGVAPGVRLWAVKVLNANGAGYNSWIIAGIDWVTAHANQIEVANMSIGGPMDAKVNSAIKTSVEAGVVYAVAAGNDHVDAKNSSPASSPDAITVSALADYDGKAGGKGSPTCSHRGPDDTLANFSNFGKVVDIAAPGVCIRSTWPGGYATISGTSMASPHVAGAAAILAAADNPNSKADVEAIRATLTEEGNQDWIDNSGDGVGEPLLDVSDTAAFHGPAVVTRAAEILSEGEVELRGSLNPGGLKTTYQFEYGTDESYGSTVPASAKDAGSGTGYVAVGQALSGLQGHTLYHYRLVASNSKATTHGADRVFTTTLPVAETRSVRRKGGRIATLRGFVNPNGVETAYQFEYGKTDSYGSEAPLDLKAIGSDSGDVAVSETLENLEPNTTYHFRVATRSAGRTVYSEDRAFKTGSLAWTQGFPPMGPAPETSQFNGLSCANEPTPFCAAIGSWEGTSSEAAQPMGMLYLSSSSWKRPESLQMPEGAQSGELKAISCASIGICLAVGNYRDESSERQPLLEQAFGGLWELQADPPNPGSGSAGFEGIDCPSWSECALVGSYNGLEAAPLVETLKRTWNEEEEVIEDDWTVHSVPKPAGAIWSPLTSVSCSSANACIAVGSYETDASDEFAYAERWDGSKWSLQEIPKPSGAAWSRLTGISCVSIAVCFAVGAYENGAGEELPLAAAWSGGTWSLRTVPIPGEADSAQLQSVSCLAEGECTAVGHYEESDAGAAFSAAWNGLIWTIEEAPLTGDGDYHPYGIACPEDEPCMAAGIDEDASLAFAARGSGSNWAALKVPLPAIAAYLQSVSCAAGEECMAVGATTDQSGKGLPLSATWDGSQWIARDVPQPPGVELGDFWALRGVSCPTTDQCMGVGSYNVEDPGEGAEGFPMAATWNGSGWSLLEVPEFPNARRSALTRVSCSSMEFCVATGEYHGYGQADAALSYTAFWDGSEWSIEEVPLPSGSIGSVLDSVSCASNQDCVAMGSYRDSNSVLHVWPLRWDGTKWALQALSLPAGATYAYVRAVSCAGPDFCVGVGEYTEDGVDLPLVVHWNGAEWSLREAPVLQGTIAASLRAVSCVSAEACTAIGTTSIGNKAYVQGYERKFLVERWNGIDWTTQDIGKPASIFSPEVIFDGNTGASNPIELFAANGISCASVEECTAVGNSDSTPMAMRYGPVLPQVMTEAASAKSHGAVLNGVVDPEGFATTYHFEYDTTPYEGEKAHGTSVPVPEESAGAGGGDVEVQEAIEGLKAGTEYHYRVVATSSAGTSYGEDEAFTTEAEKAGATFLFGFGSSGKGNGQLQEPVDVAVDASGNLWVTDTGNNRVQKFNSKGEYLSQFGSEGKGNGQFEGPAFAAVDASGNLWITDCNNSRVQKFNSKGEYLLQFGSEGTGNGQFNCPMGISVDASGNTWVADCNNSRVQKFNSKGEYLSQFGTEGKGNGQLHEPLGIAVDASGNVWVVDYDNDRVQEFDSKGKYLSQFGEAGSGNGQFSDPYGIALDPLGHLWVTNAGGTYRVQEFDSKGKYLSQFGEAGSGSGQFYPSGLETDASGNIWVVDTGNNRVQKWVPNRPAPALVTEAASEIGTSEATLNATVNPNGLDTTYHFEYDTTPYEGEKAHGTSVPVPEESAGAGGGDVEVQEAIEGLEAGTEYHYRVVATSSAGTSYGKDEAFQTVVTPIWAASYGSKGSGGGGFEGPQFEYPYGVAVDQEGNVWVADDLNRRVQKLSPSGQLILMVGEEVNKTKSKKEGTSEAERNLCTAISGDECGAGTGSEAAGVAVDPSGDVWVVESTTSHIAHYNTKGEYLGQVGIPGKGEGQLNNPRAVAFDEEGNLVIADQGNSRVVKLDPEGGFLAQFGEKGEVNGQFKNPSGIAVDPSGNVWVADTGNDRVQKLDPEGKFLAAYGKKGSGKGQFESPYGIAADAHGTIWVADDSNHRIQALGSGGKYVTEFGKYGTGNGQLFHPKALALGAKGDLWVADTSNHRIQRWIFPGKPEGKTENASDVKATSAMLRGLLNPNGIADYRFEYGPTSAYGSSVPVPDAEEGPGNSFTQVNKSVKGLTPVTTYHFRLVAESEFGTSYGEDKTFTTTADDRFDFSFGTSGTGNGQLKGPVGTVTDSKGNVWVADTENNRIEKFGPYGEYLSQFGSLGTGNGQLKGPKGVAIDSSGNLWVTDSGNDRVQKFSSSGEYLTQFGSTGTGNGQFKSPTGIAIDSKDRIYVVDTGNNRVQKFDSSGKYLEQGGTEGTGNGQFKAPTGIAVDASNRVWVVDTGNNRVQRLSNTLVYQAQFGSKGTGNGQLESPSSILIDYGEKLWVTDTGNDRVQRFNEAGEYLEKFGQHGSGPGQIDDPLGIASPSAWKLVFVDAANSRLQRWSMVPDPPVASTEAATELKATTATLNASINPNGLYTTYRFEYGTTTKYGTSVPVPDAYAGNGLGLVKVAKAISGLASKTKYNFRVVAISSSGTTYGVNKSFTTP